ncbi:hypothetical protein [Halobacillus ihumii]|uniref:hypothetical protein n=1 Tax=Halobacillus ihumii TaxID=2686092 RepID=UPI0013CFAB0B|nr:hypothetical protein [Halobacillus ihumii]
MIDLKRLEAIKEIHNKAIKVSEEGDIRMELGDILGELFTKKHTDWLIEQAEKVESLQQQLEAKIMLVNNGWEDERYALQNQFEQQQKALNKFHYTCYTQTCTMNHMDNTEWEKGYMRGVGFGREIAERYFGNK